MIGPLFVQNESDPEVHFSFWGKLCDFSKLHFFRILAHYTASAFDIHTNVHSDQINNGPKNSEFNSVIFENLTPCQEYFFQISPIFRTNGRSLAPTTVLDTITFCLPHDPTPKWIHQNFFQPFWQSECDNINLLSLLGFKFNPSRLGRFILSHSGCQNGWKIFWWIHFGVGSCGRLNVIVAFVWNIFDGG